MSAGAPVSLLPESDGPPPSTRHLELVSPRWISVGTVYPKNPQSFSGISPIRRGNIRIFLNPTCITIV